MVGQGHTGHAQGHSVCPRQAHFEVVGASIYGQVIAHPLERHVAEEHRAALHGDVYGWGIGRGMHKAHVSLPGCWHAVVVNQHQRFDGR